MCTLDAGLLPTHPAALITAPAPHPPPCSKGLIKRVPLKQFASIQRNGLAAMGVRVRLQYCGTGVWRLGVLWSVECCGVTCRHPLIL